MISGCSGLEREEGKNGTSTEDFLGQGKIFCRIAQYCVPDIIPFIQTHRTYMQREPYVSCRLGVKMT
jgi:hypothetical protein